MAYLLREYLQVSVPHVSDGKDKQVCVIVDAGSDFVNQCLLELQSDLLGGLGQGGHLVPFRLGHPAL